MKRKLIHTTTLPYTSLVIRIQQQLAEEVKRSTDSFCLLRSSHALIAIA